MRITTFANINLLVRINRSIKPITLLVLHRKIEVKTEGQEDNRERETAADGATLGVIGLVLRGEDGTGEERAALAEDGEDGNTCTPLGVAAVIVEEPGDAEGLLAFHVSSKVEKETHLMQRAGKMPQAASQIPA